jgi:hypothetical protein
MRPPPDTKPHDPKLLQRLEEAGKLPGGPASAAASSGAQQPIKVTRPEQARALPSGTAIILPDGSLGRVP